MVSGHKTLGSRKRRGLVLTKKAAIYVRVSTAEQNTDMQRNDLQEYADRRGYTIFHVYEDIITGAARERKALDRLIDDAKKRRFDVVLVWKFDRFARSLKMLIDHLELFQELGIDFISYQENIDTTTAMGKLVFSINAAYADFERSIIKERVKAGVKAKRAKTGRWGRQELDKPTQEKIKALRAAQVSIRGIAKQLGISVNTVRKYQ
jgi:DNA invertase Pin-like site-specific DNA recombinase